MVVCGQYLGAIKTSCFSFEACDVNICIYSLLLLTPHTLFCRILVSYKVGNFGKCNALYYLHKQREGFHLALLPVDVKTAFDWLPDSKQTQIVS